MHSISSTVPFLTKRIGMLPIQTRKSPHDFIDAAFDVDRSVSTRFRPAAPRPYQSKENGMHPLLAGLSRQSLSTLSIAGPSSVRVPAPLRSSRLAARGKSKTTDSAGSKIPSSTVSFDFCVVPAWQLLAYEVSDPTRFGKMRSASLTLSVAEAGIQR